MTARFLVSSFIVAGLLLPAVAEPQVQPLPLPGVRLQTIVEGLTHPVALAQPPDGSSRLFVVDQAGPIRIVRADGTLAPEPFLDLTSRMVALSPSYDERGALGLAFHPNYAENGRFFVLYSAPLRPAAPPGWNSTLRLSEFVVSADPDRADEASERVLLEIAKPQMNHNGGSIAFGPDGYLYISVGDGGGGNDVGTGHAEDWYGINAGGNAQNLTENLLGKILRIDPDGGDPYGIPQGNPFASGPERPEIWAFGFRNPYRMAFDPAGSRRLFVGDAGQELWEEIDLVVRGGNYGWNVKEGAHCFNTEEPTVPRRGCPAVDTGNRPLIDPIIEYANSKNGAGGLGFVVVGGVVYRGTAIPALSRAYIFGDWSRGGFGAPGDGTIFASRELVVRGDDGTPRSSWAFTELPLLDRPDRRLGHFILGFGQDLAGEVYVLATDRLGPSGTTGVVYKLVP
jgi:glucose/arabinose dehydrogenase